MLSASFRRSVPVLDRLAELDQHLGRSGSQLWLVSLPEHARADLARDRLAGQLGPERVVHSLDAARASTAPATGP